MTAIQVAVGVVRNAEGEILLAKRADKAHQGGLWEFPGGKVDTGETVRQALSRELAEELAIDVTDAQPLIRIHHQYPELQVCLDVWEVTGFTGEPVGNEGQPLQWVSVESLADYPLPTANAPIVTALQLPPQMVVTGGFTSPADFQRKLSRALTHSQLIYLRPVGDGLPISDELIRLAEKLCREQQATLVLNNQLVSQSRVAQDFLHQEWVGLHLNAVALRDKTIPADWLKTARYLGASCHNDAELQAAAALAVDYVTLSPVLPTASHSDAKVLGWQGFAELVDGVNLPVYGLGGLRAEDLARVRQNGGQGVAGIGHFWNQ